MKKKKISTEKKKLWKLFSQYIRLRDSDEYGMVKCCTCETRKPWKEMQAGHFIPRAQGNSVYFDERNVNGQCYRCNINLGGNGPEYYSFMLEKYGQEVIDELKTLQYQTKKFTIFELEEMQEKYKKLKEIT